MVACHVVERPDDGAGLGQGGSNFELEGVFTNKKLALNHVSDKPMAAIE